MSCCRPLTTEVNESRCVRKGDPKREPDAGKNPLGEHLAAFGQVRREPEEHALVSVASRGTQRMEVSSIQHPHRQRESKSLVTAELPRAARAHGANSGDVLRRALALIVNTREIERGKEMRHVVFILQ